MRTVPTSSQRKSRLVRPDRSIISAIGRILYWAGYFAEHFLALEIEIGLRLVRRLDPRIYMEALRVRNVIAGAPPKSSNKYAILVLYSEERVPTFTSNLIEALKASAFNVVLVSNGRLDDSARKELIRDCYALIERNNIGRDFGAYKDAISFLLRGHSPIDRLLIANDSVFYLPDNNLDKAIIDLDGAEDFIGISEVLDHHYHIASFMMSFGKRVLESDAFVSFWNRFLPIGTRRWNIFRGEGALTAKLINAGFRPHVLFRAEHLRPHLLALNSGQLETALSVLPTYAKKFVANRVKADSGITIPDAIVDAIKSRNQMHTGGLLFRKYLGLSMLKRDIFYRGICSPDLIAAELNNIDELARDEIIADLRRRGTYADLGWFRKFLYRHSAA